MALQVFDFEGTNGATLSGTGLSLLGAGTAAFSAADAVVGSTGARFTATAGNSRMAEILINNGKVQALDFFVRTPSVYPGAGLTSQLFTLRQASGQILAFEVLSTGSFSVFENGGVTRNAVPSTTGSAVSTIYRVQILVSIGVSTNDSTMSCKVFTSGSNWTTQYGTTLTRTGINLGTAAATKVQIGAITAATPGMVVGADYLRVDDGKTTDFTAPPTASSPTAVTGASDQYPEVLTSVNLTSTGSTAGTGSITGYSWVCTAFPDGAALPEITNPTSATASFVPQSAGRYTFQLVVTQTGGLTDDDTITIYVHPASGNDVTVYAVTPGVWTNEGGAPTFVAALNDTNAATFHQSVANPSGQIDRVTMNPYGPGSITFYVSGLYAGGALNRTASIYMADGVTLLMTETWALTSTEVEHPIALDAGDLATASEGVNRRALIIDISDAV